jgi:hypothetical protein
VEVSKQPVLQLQRSLTAALTKERSKRVLERLPFRGEGQEGYAGREQWMRTVHLHASDNPVSGAFLTAHPSVRVTSMSDMEYSDAARIYVGGVVREANLVRLNCPKPGCAAQVERFPAHDFTCDGTKGLRASRHHTVKFALHRFLVQYKKLMQAPPKVEPRLADYFRPPNGNPTVHKDFRGTRLDEAIHLFGEDEMLLDYVVTSVSATTRDLAAAESVARKGHEKKRKRYSRLVPNRSWGKATIVPVAFSSLGRPEAQGIEAFRQMAKSLAGNNNAQYAMILRRICEVTSVAIWRGNSGLVRAYSRMIETAHRQTEQEEAARRSNARRRNGPGPDPPTAPPPPPPAETSSDDNPIRNRRDNSRDERGNSRRHRDITPRWDSPQYPGT